MSGRELGWQARRWLILRDMPEGLRKLELVEWVKERFGIERSQARRELDWLEKEKGCIAAVADERDRRIKRIHRTEAGRRRIESWKKTGTPFEFRKGRPNPAGRAAAEVPAAEPARDPEPTPVPPPSLAKPSRSPISVELAADRAEMRRRERALIDDVHRVHIAGDRWTYLQLLLPLEEWAFVRLHEQLRVGFDGDGLPVHRSFVSPKDKALGGPDASDPIDERTRRDGGYEASDKLLGVAAELVKSGAGFELATHLEDGERVPNVGLLVQSHANFYAPLLALDPPEGSVIASRKRGKGLGTTYEFMIAGEGIEIPAGHEIDLDTLLHRLADEDEMRAVLDSLPESWQLVKRPRW